MTAPRPRRSALRRLLSPADRRPAPAPLEVDLRPVILVGTAVWAVVLVVAVVATIAGARGGTVCAVAAVGMALGGTGLLWDRRNRARYMPEPVEDESGRPDQG